MKDALDTLGIEVSPKLLGDLFKLTDISGDGRITNAEFVHVFKRYNKTSYERGEETSVDWKFEVMARLDKVSQAREASLEEVFNEMDIDGDGQVTIKELDGLFRKMSIKIERREFEKLFYAIDTNRSGFMSYSEFLNYINRSKKEVERVHKARMIDSRRNLDATNSMTNMSLYQSEYDPHHNSTANVHDANANYELKLALMKGKESSAHRELEKVKRKLRQTMEELVEEERSSFALKDAETRTKCEYFREKEKRTKLEGLY